MPAFSYTALNPKGRQISGVREADSARVVRRRLRDEGLAPLDVKKLASATKRGGKVSRRDKLSWTELALITQQLATLIKASLPIEQALRACADQAESARVARLLTALRARVNEGQSLSAAMAEFPGAFPPMLRTSVSAGEESGKLPEVLAKLAEHAQEQETLRREVLMALIYPIILSSVAVLVVIGLIVFVIPQVVQVFDHMDKALPTLTVLMLAFSDTLTGYGHWLLVGLALIIFSAKKLHGIEALRARWDGWVLRLPVLRKSLRQINAAHLIRTLATLVGSGVPVVKSLSISANVVQNRAIRTAMDQVSTRVREGSSLTKALREAAILPPLTQELIAAGEASGELGAMLERAANQLESELSARIQTLVKLFEPLLILLMGGMVLLIVLAVLLPIFDMNTLVR